MLKRTNICIAMSAFWITKPNTIPCFCVERQTEEEEEEDIFIWVLFKFTICLWQYNSINTSSYRDMTGKLDFITNPSNQNHIKGGFVMPFRRYEPNHATDTVGTISASRCILLQPTACRNQRPIPNSGLTGPTFWNPRFPHPS